LPKYRDYPDAGPMLIGYDPEWVLANDHLARLVDRVVDESIAAPISSGGAGQPAYDPRVCLKVLIFGYATGIRSSRQLERLCCESMAYLYLTRGQTPAFRTLCTARTTNISEFEQCWIGLFAVARQAGIKRIGRVDVDSTKIRANVSPESVLKESEFAFFLETLKKIIQQAEDQDRVEDAEGQAGQTFTGKPVERDDMRDVIRNVRQAYRALKKGDSAAPAAPVNLGPSMLARVRQAVRALEEVTNGQKHLSLTDTDAQMMKEGRTKRIMECHAFEIAADNGLLVCAQSSQSPTDNNRLMGLFAAASEHEPEGVHLLVADSGYYGGDNVALLEQTGIATCIPDSNTARAIRCGLAVGDSGSGAAAMTYEADTNSYRCAQGRFLSFVQRRQHAGCEVDVYRAEKSCQDCALRKECMKSDTGTRRMLKVPVHRDKIEQIRSRFLNPEHQKRYHERGKNVETVFAFLRTAMNFNRWSLRGKERVASEAALLRVSYQIRKVHSGLRNSNKALAA
jgi:transposase